MAAFNSQFQIGDQVTFSIPDLESMNGVVTAVNYVNELVNYDITVGDPAHATIIWYGIPAPRVVGQIL